LAYKNCDAGSLSAHPTLAYFNSFKLPSSLGVAVVGCSEMSTSGPLILIKSNARVFSFLHFGNHFENDATIKTTAKEKINPLDLKDFYVMLRGVAASRKTSNLWIPRLKRRMTLRRSQIKVFNLNLNSFIKASR
jgi:hypothetical protein